MLACKVHKPFRRVPFDWDFWQGSFSVEWKPIGRPEIFHIQCHRMYPDGEQGAVNEYQRIK